MATPVPFNKSFRLMEMSYICADTRSPTIPGRHGMFSGVRRWNDWFRILYFLGAPRFIGAPLVNENDDLDNLTEHPLYRCNNSSITRTISNRPAQSQTSYGFILLYLRPSTGANGNQIFIQQTSIWIRFKPNSQQATWGDWKKLLTEE